MSGTPIENRELSNSNRKRKANTNDESPQEKQNETENGPRTTYTTIYDLSESQLKYRSRKLTIFPDVEAQYVTDQCLNIEDELDLNHIIISQMLSHNYPCEKAQEIPDSEKAADLQAGPSTFGSMEDKLEGQYKILIATFPNTDSTYLREKCEALAGNEKELMHFITAASKDKTEYLMGQVNQLRIMSYLTQIGR